ncbi:unnamed protein product [Diabrotica balteata]|uniref:V-SNARE coiled-coil homology domain-containing protein n=1 Tax=Diabrotica balteata TaxID=107213 RepID=A0A9P0GZ73_DIABA|nr:unnamed protein product [Diabrotica balteata]
METPGASRAPSKLEQTQQQVNEVVGIMRVNVEKVLERDQKLSELDSRADALQEGGKRFEQQAQKLKRKYWWKNIKMMIIMGVIGLIILIIIIISIANAVKDKDSTTSSTTPSP